MKYYIEYEFFQRIYDSLMQHIHDEERRYQNKIKYIDADRDWDRETTLKHYMSRLENARIKRDNINSLYNLAVKRKKEK